MTRRFLRCRSPQILRVGDMSVDEFKWHGLQQELQRICEDFEKVKLFMLQNVKTTWEVEKPMWMIHLND